MPGGERASVGPGWPLSPPPWAAVLPPGVSGALPVATGETPSGATGETSPTTSPACAFSITWFFGSAAPTMPGGKKAFSDAPLFKSCAEFGVGSFDGAVDSETAAPGSIFDELQPVLERKTVLPLLLLLFFAP